MLIKNGGLGLYSTPVIHFMLYIPFKGKESINGKFNKGRTLHCVSPTPRCVIKCRIRFRTVIYSQCGGTDTLTIKIKNKTINTWVCLSYLRYSVASNTVQFDSALFRSAAFFSWLSAVYVIASMEFFITQISSKKTNSWPVNQGPISGFDSWNKISWHWPLRPGLSIQFRIWIVFILPYQVFHPEEKFSIFVEAQEQRSTVQSTVLDSNLLTLQPKLGALAKKLQYMPYP